MQFNVAICDDEIKETEYIRSLIKKYDMEYELNFNVDIYNSSRDFLKIYKTAGQYDIIFLDVEMPGISGIELARNIRHIPDSLVKIVFISNYPEYMQDSFDVQAFNYLTKPLTYKSFCKLISKLIDQIKSGRDNIIILDTEHSSVKLPIRDIIYIKTINNSNGMLQYITTDNSFICRGLLSDEEKRLKLHSFISPHRGILVNLLHVHFLKSKDLVLDNGESLPISRRQEKYVKSIFSKGILTIYH